MPEFEFEKPDLGEEFEEPYPHFLAVSKGGMSLRFTLWPHREPSTSRGRLYGRLKKGDEFVAAFQVYAEDDVCALTRRGKLLCCNVMDVNLLAGAGKGVKLIKVDANDEVVAAFKADQRVEVKKSSGGSQLISGKDRKLTARAGKGKALFQRGHVKGIALPPPVVPVLDPEEAT
jgi:DNA gyrase subunit A